MPKIIFDNLQEQKVIPAHQCIEKNPRSRSDEMNRGRHSYDSQNVIFPRKRTQAFKEKRALYSNGFHLQKDTKKTYDRFPFWVACMLFSLLGTFATFAPICSISLPYDDRTFNMSFTAIDLLKSEIGSLVPFLNISKFEFYFITTISFTISFITSIVLKEDVIKKPYVVVITSVIAISGILIPFGFDLTLDLITKYNGISLAIQLVCAFTLIAINIIPLKKIIAEKEIRMTR